MYIITTPLENILFTPEWTPDSKGYYWVAANNTSFLTQRKRNLHQAPTPHTAIDISQRHLQRHQHSNSTAAILRYLPKNYVHTSKPRKHGGSTKSYDCKFPQQPGSDLCENRFFHVFDMFNSESSFCFFLFCLFWFLFWLSF